jgi:hypothetical protein
LEDHIRIRGFYVEKRIVPPSVARVTEGLRDTGYTFVTAVADIVDNSIAAGATKVDIRIVATFDKQVLVSIGDNGQGMSEDGLVDAMTYGSPARANPKSLGKFGLGLKTASTAFCRRLVVVSRGVGSAAVAATWDLDVLASKNDWYLTIDDASKDQVDLLNYVAGQGTGTVVIWENVDRISISPTEKSPSAITKLVARHESMLRDHVSTVYQRFLDPADSREPTVQIVLNGKECEAWDPFCIAETKGPVDERKVDATLPNGGTASFTVKAFILPRKEEFSSEENRKAARIANERQGIYVYRENRLIHGPDWMGMFKQEPHSSLLRVELSFDHNLDESFQVDIKKSKIALDPGLYDFLREKFLAGPRREAERRYRKGAASVATSAAALLHAPSSSVIDQKSGALTTASISIVDEGTGEVSVENKSGSTKATLHMPDPSVNSSVRILTESTLEHGALWEPSLGKGGVAAVALNTGHPFYAKAYLPNKANGPVVQALDYLLWALAQAEMNNINDANQEAFEEFRVEVSRNLKKLVADLPDAASDENE